MSMWTPVEPDLGRGTTASRRLTPVRTRRRPPTVSASGEEPDRPEETDRPEDEVQPSADAGGRHADPPPFGTPDPTGASRERLSGRTHDEARRTGRSTGPRRADQTPMAVMARSTRS